MISSLEFDDAYTEEELSHEARLEFLKTLLDADNTVSFFNKETLEFLSYFYNQKDPSDWLRIRQWCRSRNINVQDLEKGVEFINRNNDAEEEIIPPPLYTIQQFIEQPPNMQGWIVENLIPSGGMSVLAADPKSGKSTLVRNIIDTVTMGGIFLGRVCRKVRTVYWCLEENEDEVREHFKRLGTRGQELVIRCGQTPKSIALQNLDADIREHKAQLAVVDPLFDVLNVEEANAYSEVNREMKKLLSVGRKNECHILAVHHTNKAMGNMNASGILGSQAIRASTNTNMMMKRMKGGKRFLLTEQRYGTEMPATQVDYNPETGRVTFAVKAESKREPGATLRERILTVLASEPFTGGMLQEMLEADRSAVFKILGQLVDDGFVVREKQGRQIFYHLVTEDMKSESV